MSALDDVQAYLAKTLDNTTVWAGEWSVAEVREMLTDALTLAAGEEIAS